jgi:predicted nucleic acid-binding protein
VDKRPALDSDVIIDYLRGLPAAANFIRGLSERPLISAITVGELYSGVRDGDERRELEIVVSGFRVIQVTRSIAIRAGLYRRQYRKSHGVQLPDALIAATADEMRAQLFTLNIGHFPMILDARMPYHKV